MLIQKGTLAIVSSLIGAFLVSYFSGFVMGFLRNIGDIIERFRAGEKIEPADYVFFSFFVILFLIGIIV